MNNKLKGYLGQIIGMDMQEVMNKRTIFATTHQQRVQHLQGLKGQGLKGKAYSDAVIAYDKQFTQ